MIISEAAVLIRLLIGHLASDFLLQSHGMVAQKERKVWRSPLLYAHSGLYAAVIYLASAQWTQWFWLIPMSFVSHTAIDGWKSAKGNRTATFLADQFAHLAVLGTAFGLLTGRSSAVLNGFGRLWDSPRSLAVVLGFLFVIWPVGRLMAVLTEPFRRQLGEEKLRGLELAGLWIGCLERLFLLSFVLLDYPAGIALLLGLKSLFRFGEIKEPSNRKETEYILIGTLLSYAFALATGIILKAALRALA